MMSATEASPDTNYVLPESIDFLRDNGLVHDLIDQLRWGSDPYCPRCTSKYAKRVNTMVFRQLYRCMDCGYMFNSLSGSIFQGAKMPLYKFLHYFILKSAVGDALTLRDVIFALDVSHKTASVLAKRVDEMEMPTGMARMDRAESNAKLASEDDAVADDRFFSYCRMRGILVSPTLLTQFLAVVARDQTHMRAFQEAALAQSRKGKQSP